MGVYNEQGAVVEEPESCHMLIKANKDGSSSLPSRSRLSKLSPRDVHNDMMFMVGGWTQDDPSGLVEQFCPEYNEWRAATRMVNSRGCVAVGTLDGKIYAVGGEDNIRCYSSVERGGQVQSSRATICHPFPNTPERYSSDTDSWSADVAPLSSPRSGVCLVAMDGYLYAIGGHDNVSVTNTVERYDPKMNTWSKQVPMLSRRTRAVAAVLHGYLYVMGGNDGETTLNSVERYNPADGTWSICAYMLSPRENAGCTVYLGCIYVAGGKDELSLQLCGAERFDPHNMKWWPVKRMRNKRDNTSLVVFNGALLAIGGHDGVTNLKTIEVYSHESNTWRHFGSMKNKHPGGRVAVLC